MVAANDADTLARVGEGRSRALRVRLNAVRMAGALKYRLRRSVGRLALDVAERLNERFYLPLAYAPPVQRPRYGHGRREHARLAEIIGRHDGRYRANLELLARYERDLLAIDRHPGAPHEPYWMNEWLTGLDAVSLYGFLRSRAPAHYLEVGSGLSTLFAARAVRDGGLRTAITSIDPEPRASVDRVCDRAIRSRVEDVSPSVFEQLGGGDVVFVDGSHQVFMNSDATTFFLEHFPELPVGILIGIHDVFLPSDYPPAWRDWYLSEQYLLAAYLLAEGSSIQPELACNYVASRPYLASALAPLFDHEHLEGVIRGSSSFWMTKAG